jgi:hypothetical protein
MENQQLEKSKLFDLTAVVTSLKQGELKIQQVRKYISDIREELDTIEILDENDSDNMQKVHELKQKLVKQRTPLEGERKLINSNYITPLKNHVDRTYKDVTDEIEEVEGHSQIVRLKQMKELAEIKKEQAKLAKEKEIDDKINQLCDLSFEFNGLDRYTNGRGQSFDRMIIQMMNESDWLSFLGIAQSSHEVIKKEKQEEEERQKKIQCRKNEFAILGLQHQEGKVIVMDLVSNSTKEFQLDFENEINFNDVFNKIKELLDANFIHQHNFKKYQEEQERKAKEQEAEHRRLADEKRKIAQGKIEMYAKKLEDVGFKFRIAPTYEQSSFEYISPKGNVKINTIDILELDAETIVTNAIAQAQGYNKEIANDKEAEAQKQIAETQRLEREKQAQIEAEEKEIQEKLRQEQEEEAKKKKKVAPSLKKIDTAISAIKSQSIILELDPIIEPYFNNLVSQLSNIIDSFQDKVKHLR